MQGEVITRMGILEGIIIIVAGELILKNLPKLKQWIKQRREKRK